MDRKKGLGRYQREIRGKDFWTGEPEGKWEKLRYFLPLLDALLDEFLTAA